MPELTASEARAAIEQELRRWLERDRARAASRPLEHVEAGRLRCLACGGVSPPESRFCVHCGVRFNVTVVSA